jgi:hypothetical protein
MGRHRKRPQHKRVVAKRAPIIQIVLLIVVIRQLWRWFNRR